MTLGTTQVCMSHLSPSGQNKENNKMASPRRRRLRKMLRAGLLKAAGAAEAAAEVVAPAPAPALWLTHLLLKKSKLLKKWKKHRHQKRLLQKRQRKHLKRRLINYGI